MIKGEISCFKQFLLFSQCFPQLYIFSASKCRIVWLRVNAYARHIVLLPVSADAVSQWQKMFAIFQISPYQMIGNSTSWFSRLFETDEKRQI